jgi:HD superfamily phosphohydrolase
MLYGLGQKVKVVRVMERFLSFLVFCFLLIIGSLNASAKGKLSKKNCDKIAKSLEFIERGTEDYYAAQALSEKTECSKADVKKYKKIAKPGKKKAKNCRKLEKLLKHKHINGNIANEIDGILKSRNGLCNKEDVNHIKGELKKNKDEVKKAKKNKKLTEKLEKIKKELCPRSLRDLEEDLGKKGISR